MNKNKKKILNKLKVKYKMMTKLTIQCNEINEINKINEINIKLNALMTPRLHNLFFMNVVKFFYPKFSIF